MKSAYPIVLTPTSIDGKSAFAVYVPDLEINTQGYDLADAIFMARDAIGLWGISRQDNNHPIPNPSGSEPPHDANELVSWVDIDFSEYRRKHDNRAVRRNITLPAWLDEAAKDANINVSGFIQSALREHLGLSKT